MDRFTRFKAMLTAVAAAAAASAVCIPASSAADYVLEIPEEIVTMFGDVNSDAKIGISDAVQLQRYLLGQSDDLGNWKNADLINDKNIDVFDFIKLRKIVSGEETPEGSKLTIKVVDMMTGEPLDGVSVTLNSEYDIEEYSAKLFPLGEWVTGEDDEISLFGLPNDEEYTYLISVEDLPDNYGHTYGCWWGNIEFTLDANDEDKEYIVRVLPDDAERDLSATFFDWTKGEEQYDVGTLRITDKDGSVYYPSLYAEKFALPDGEYHAEFNLFDNPFALLDPDGEFADELKELFPDEVFSDWTSGVDFTVKDGQLTEDLRVELGPKEGVSNAVSVACYDIYTGEPLEGAKLSLIASPETDPEVVKQWTSSADGATVIDGLRFAGTNPYTVKVDSPPEGYTGSGEQPVTWYYIHGYTQEIKFYFAPDNSEKNVLINIYNWDDDCAAFNDLCGIDIWSYDDITEHGKVASGVKAGEAFSLPDGTYVATLDSTAAKKKGYSGINLMTDTGKAFREKTDSDAYLIFTTDWIRFTVKDGVPDIPVELYVTAASEEEPDLSFLDGFFGSLGGTTGLGDLEGLEDLF